MSDTRFLVQGTVSTADGAATKAGGAASAERHAQALDLAAATPAFRLDPQESRELDAHLRGCPTCAGRVAGMRADAAALGRLDPPVSARLHDRVREIAMTSPRSGAGVLGVVLAMLLLAMLVIGASVGAGALLTARPANPGEPQGPSLAPADGGAGDAVDWRTEVVAMAASNLTIEANGLTFSGAGTAQVDSDPGDLHYWTLESQWTEHGRVQRINLYFGADQAAWWIDEIRVADGSADRSPGWATFGGGPWARTPLGATYQGDLDLRGSASTGPVRLQLGGLRIAVAPQDPVMHPPLGGIVLRENGNPAVDGNPFEPGGPLHCSGILQLPPKAAEIRLLALGYQLSWRWEYSTGSMSGYAEARTSAPEAGWISGTAIGSSGELIVFVEDPSRPTTPAATTPGDCTTTSP